MGERQLASYTPVVIPAGIVSAIGWMVSRVKPDASGLLASLGGFAGMKKAKPVTSNASARPTVINGRVVT